MVEETLTSFHHASGKPSSSAVEGDVDDSSSTITGASRLLVKDFQPNHECVPSLHLLFCRLILLQRHQVARSVSADYRSFVQCI